MTLLDKYPRWIILTRWFLVAAEMGLATYSVMAYSLNLGLLFVVYGVISIFLLLPMIRCVRCYYYGKLCNFGWGLLVSKFFPKAENSPYPSTYGFTMAFWPLRIIPIGLGFLNLLDGYLNSGFAINPHGLFGIYLLVILIHRRFYRAVACTRCHQCPTCPVYDSKAVLRTQ
jgi:hypothetical protein